MTRELEGPAFRSSERFQGDPADSLYRAASDLFGRGEYRAAADRFAEVRSRFPTSRYLCNAWYNEAFARYRLGFTEDLRNARRLLTEMASRCPAQNQDVPGLTLRVNTALARTGDAAAVEAVRRAATDGESCDPEERSVRIAALNALAQSEPDSASSLFRTLLSRRDACSAPVRSQAMGIVARHNTADAAALLSQSARTDPELSNRRTAIRHLGTMPNDEALATLEMLLRDPDRTLQIEAAGAVSRMAGCAAPGATTMSGTISGMLGAASGQGAAVVAGRGGGGGGAAGVGAAGRGAAAGGFGVRATTVEVPTAVMAAQNRCNPRASTVLRTIIIQRDLPDSVRLAAIEGIGSQGAAGPMYSFGMAETARPVQPTPAPLVRSPRPTLPGVVTPPPAPPPAPPPPGPPAPPPAPLRAVPPAPPPPQPSVLGAAWSYGSPLVELSTSRRALGAAIPIDAELRQALVSVAADSSESSQLRSAALLKVRGSASVADLARVYATAESRALRLAVVNAIGSRSEPEATDRLIEIAKASTDPEVRNAAIRILGAPDRKGDPKVQKALAEILSCCGG